MHMSINSLLKIIVLILIIFSTCISFAQDNVELTYCDDNNDGYLIFDSEELIEQIIQINGMDNDHLLEQIVVSSSSGVFAINNPSSSPNIVSICDEYSAYDVAVDSNQNIYLTGLFRIDDDCLVYSYSVNPWHANSLSFDDLDQLYMGYGSESYVTRRQGVPTGTITYSEIWHDFNVGTAGGDFVLFNEKIYISWRLGSNNYRLYEVTVNENRDYISHVDLGQLPNKTYGLAKEFGRLYGITPTKLYEISVEDFSFTDIYENPNTEVEWYGAAGLHEAVTFNLTLHSNLDDAQTGNNALTGEWTNTLPYEQTIFFRIENTLTGAIDLVHIDLFIYDTPVVNPPIDLEECYVDEYRHFDFNQVTNQMIIENGQNLEFTYHDSDPFFHESSIPLPLNYQPYLETQSIFVKVKNLEGGCYKVYPFNIINRRTPSIAQLSTLEEPTELTNCHLDVELGGGYFDLSEIESTITQGYLNYNFEYYLSYTDAELGLNEISNIYYLTEQNKEIFIKVIDTNGCFSISNFFIFYDCIKNNLSTAYIVFPKFFTPNNDNVNDYWNVKGISERLMQGSKITIFNRYGKVLASFRPSDTIGWDGTANGVSMPANDYWIIFETNFGYTKTSHFALKR